MTDQQPGGVAGRVITNLNEARFSDHDSHEESTKLHGQWVGAVHLQRELSRESRAILAEVWAKHERMLDLAAEPRPTIEEKQYKVLHTAFTRLGLNLDPEDGND